jgi:hypothetical protein
VGKASISLKYTFQNQLFVESVAATSGCPQPPPIQSAAAAPELGILERLSLLRFLEGSGEHEHIGGTVDKNEGAPEREWAGGERQILKKK